MPRWALMSQWGLLGVKAELKLVESGRDLLTVMKMTACSKTH